jgi:importin-7
MDEEEIEKFCSALDLSVSSDNTLRKEAETFLVESMEKPHFVVAMLQIASNPDYNANRNIDITQAAAIQLKNMAESHWRYKDDELSREMKEDGWRVIIIPEEDKQYVRDNILISYSNVHSEIVARQIDYTIRCITKIDFPDKWPELAHIVREYINTPNTYSNKVFVGLYTLKSIWKRYEYEFNVKREPLNEIVDELFPRCEEIVNDVLADNGDDGCRLKNVIGQWFYIANQLQLCNRYKTSEALDSLVQFFKTWLESEIDEHLTTKTESIPVIDERIKSQQWKLKETSMHFLFRILQKYGNPEYVDNTQKEIAQHCWDNYVDGLINLAITLIEKSEEFFISARVINFCFKICSTAINHPTSIEYIKPHIENLLNAHMIPSILLTEKDVDDFESDPIEFVRKTRDSSDTVYSAKSSVLDFITHATRYRSNKEDENSVPDYLEKFFQYCIDNLSEYAKQESPDYRIKDALLLAIGQMAITIMKYPKFRESLEIILKECTFPDFSSENAFLKYRAWWLFGEYSRLPMSSDLRLEAGKALFHSMYDDNLPIKITSSSSLYRILRNKELKESFKSELARILEAYLSMMDSIDNDELISGLEEIVRIYEDCIEPFAIDLCSKIVENYKKLATKDNEEEYGTLGMASSALVTTVKWILEAVKNNKELLLKIEPIIFPMVVSTLTPDGLECIDEAMECMTLIMFETKTATDRMWSLFPHLLKIGKS